MRNITLLYSTKLWFMAWMFFMLLLLLVSCAENFSYAEDNSVVIDSISPRVGYTGDLIRVYGKGFSSAADSNRIFINGIPAAVSEPVSLSTLLVKVPAQAKTGKVSIEVFNEKYVGPTFTVLD